MSDETSTPPNDEGTPATSVPQGMVLKSMRAVVRNSSAGTKM